MAEEPLRDNVAIVTGAGSPRQGEPLELDPDCEDVVSQVTDRVRRCRRTEKAYELGLPLDVFES